MRTIFAGLVALFLAFSSFAATVAERSPFAQGHWWDPTRPGHGLELLNAGGQVFMVWYTYDANGLPTWYTAQGPQAQFGERWNLMRHEWADGRIARSTVVGGVRLTPVHSEGIAFHWQIGTATGSWNIEPFRESGVVNEVDLTGHWYNPANSGWGMTLVDQGDVFGGVIYAYDRSGAPIWVAGFERGKGTRIGLSTTRGTCPWCTYKPITTQPAGSINIEYTRDTDIVIRGAPTVAFADGVRIDGTRAYQLGRPSSMRAADRQLAAVAREDTFRDRITVGMTGLRFRASGSDFSASPAGPAPADFSATNLQEEGVDEASLVKTNGRYLYTVSATTSALVPRVRIAYVGGDGSLVQPHADVALSTSAARNSWEPRAAGIYLHRNDLVAVSGSSYYEAWNYAAPQGATAWIEVMSLAQPDRPTSRWVAKLSGALVSSRRIGDRLYVVTRFSPMVPGYNWSATTDAQRAANAALIASTPIGSLLPMVSVNGGDAVPAVSFESVYVPPIADRQMTADMVVVTAFDLAAPALAQGMAVLGHTEGIYVSPANLYIASARRSYFYSTGNDFGTRPPRPAVAVTDVHQIRLGSTAMSLVGSGSVEGMVGYDINKVAFRFGEHQGRVGVVTGSQAGWGGGQANRLTILEPSTIQPGLLKTVSWLPNASRPQPLGKPGELLYGTRFVGDRLYAVTFKKIDPLYIVDLSNAADPYISGELEIPGFSDYLHPMPNGLLLGLGKDAKPADRNGDAGFAWYQGLQLSLYDVSGTAPRELQRVLLGKRGSDSAALGHHHAFSALQLADGATAIAFPASITEGAPSYDADWASSPYSYSGLMRFEVRGTSSADAVVVQRPSLVTHHAAAGPDLLGSIGAAAGYAWSGTGVIGAGRSVLFPQNTLYIASGRIWRQDAAGSTTGPY